MYVKVEKSVTVDLVEGVGSKSACGEWVQLLSH